MAGETPLIRVSNLCVNLPDMTRKPLFGRAPLLAILHDLTFDIPAGSVLGVVGQSGSGKSTLARAMLRLIEPSSGQITFDGQDIAHFDEAALKPFRRKAQMIFQDPMSSLNPRHRVERIVATPLVINGQNDARARAAEALDLVGLSRSFLTRYPHELSGGQRQRVGIARAIAMRPQFILADEIVSGLDVSSQAQVLNLLERLVRELKLTLAFISHDLSVIRRLCTHVLVLRSGRIVEHATVEDVFGNPQAAYTRELMDAIPLPDPDQPGWKA